MKTYKAIFFDWDGTAVLSRKAPVDRVIEPMKALLSRGVPLIIISGTTYDKIAGGGLENFFTASELKNLFLGLGRGSANYRFDGTGKPFIWRSRVPGRDILLKIHEICFEIHKTLLRDYGLMTDIVFSRPNYCKLDLVVESDRGDNLFMMDGEIGALRELLASHGIDGGLPRLIGISRDISEKHGLPLSATCDAKYLEVGLSDKSDNVNDILGMLLFERSISAKDCAFWGDEYIGADAGVFGSDSFMITDISREGDFFDVSDTVGERPENVRQLGGGVETFLNFLHECLKWDRRE